MGLFEMLKAVRAFENKTLPFLRTMIDFDIVVEIGHAEELEKPLTMTGLFLLDIASRSTVRRRLTALIAQGVVVKVQNEKDGRAALLSIGPASYELMHKYGTTLVKISGTMLLEEMKLTAA